MYALKYYCFELWAKKIPVKGKDTQEPFPLTRILPSLLSDPSPPNLVEGVLERMKIGHRKKHFPQQLSGGQQQRVAIARAVVANPKLILADEPTGNLDSKNGLEVMKLLTELNKEGTTIIMVTHSEHDAGFSHRIINLFDGKIITEEMKRKFEAIETEDMIEN